MTAISKILKIDGSLDSFQLRFEDDRIVLEDREQKYATVIGNAEIPLVIALLEAARDELLDVRAHNGRREPGYYFGERVAA